MPCLQIPFTETYLLTTDEETNYILLYHFRFNKRQIVFHWIIPMASADRCLFLRFFYHIICGTCVRHKQLTRVVRLMQVILWYCPPWQTPALGCWTGPDRGIPPVSSLHTGGYQMPTRLNWVWKYHLSVTPGPSNALATSLQILHWLMIEIIFNMQISADKDNLPWKVSFCYFRKAWLNC